MQLNKNQRILAIIAIVVVSFAVGNIWGTHRLPFHGDALQSSANVGGGDKLKAKGYYIPTTLTPEQQYICNGGTWFLHGYCYGA